MVSLILLVVLRIGLLAPAGSDPAPMGSLPIHPIAVTKGGPARAVIWRSVPTIDQVRDAYPVHGEGRGTVSMTCAVAATGRLDACRVDYAIPSGIGFDAAALGITKLFEVAPEMLPETHGDGHQVSVSLVFEKRGEEGRPVPPDRCVPPYCNFIPSPPPPPPRALEGAH